MKNIAVFFGGESVEHDVSVITGVMTTNSLNKEKFLPVPILISSDGEWFTGDALLDLDAYKTLDYKTLKKVTLICGENALYEIKGKKHKKLFEIACAVNCLHGERGEDGSLSGLLSMCKIPLASPPVMPSAISIDKNFTKKVLRALKVKTVDGVLIKGGLNKSALEKIEYPVIVKPNRLGSSIGVSKAENLTQLRSAINLALRFGDEVLLEKCLADFIEINCAVYKKANGEIVVSECEQPIGADKVLSFNDKYENGQRVFPANIDKKIADKIKRTAKKVYIEMCFSGVIRIDFFVVGGEVYINELNTVPGSLAYYLFCKTLKEFSMMLEDLIEVALCEYAKSMTVIKKYDTGILLFSGCKSCKRIGK